MRIHDAQPTIIQRWSRVRENRQPGRHPPPGGARGNRGRWQCDEHPLSVSSCSRRSWLPRVPEVRLNRPRRTVRKERAASRSERRRNPSGRARHSRPDLRLVDRPCGAGVRCGLTAAHCGTVVDLNGSPGFQPQCPVLLKRTHPASKSQIPARTEMPVNGAGGRATSPRAPTH